MRGRVLTLTAVVTAWAEPAIAAEDNGFLGGLEYAFNDPVTHTAFLALLGFLAIAWRFGAFSTITKALDARSERFAAELDQAKALKAEATEALADAERRRLEADELAAEIDEKAKHDAERLIVDSRAELERRLERRKAQAEARVARAESDALADVRRTAADAATRAAGMLLAGHDPSGQFDRAAKEIERALSN